MIRNFHEPGIISFLIILLVGLLLLIGFVKGIIKFTRCDFKPNYKAEVVYGIGILTGLNVILGWFNFGELANGT